MIYEPYKIWDENIEISMIVFDEAHTLLWSEDFRQALARIPDFIKKLKKTEGFLSASFF